MSETRERPKRRRPMPAYGEPRGVTGGVVRSPRSSPSSSEAVVGGRSESKDELDERGDRSVGERNGDRSIGEPELPGAGGDGFRFSCSASSRMAATRVIAADGEVETQGGMGAMLSGRGMLSDGDALCLTTSVR